MKSLLFAMGLMIMVTANAAHFKTGSDIATNELKEELFKFYKDKLENQSIDSLIIEGHTDVRGSEEYNQDLSKRRAKTALDELRKLGFEGGNAVVKGFGESKPISNVHGENRRIVLRIGDDVTIIAECKPKEVIVYKKRKPLKNRIKLLGGKGPTGVDLEKKGNKTTLSETSGAVLGLSYDRLLTDRFSIGIQGQTNETYLLSIGLDF